jgi:hypothetical protein
MQSTGLYGTSRCPIESTADVEQRQQTDKATPIAAASVSWASLNSRKPAFASPISLPPKSQHRRDRTNDADGATTNA